MIRRVGKNLTVYKGDAPDASAELERDGCTVLPMSSSAFGSGALLFNMLTSLCVLNVSEMRE